MAGAHTQYVNECVKTIGWCSVCVCLTQDINLSPSHYDITEKPVPKLPCKWVAIMLSTLSHTPSQRTSHIFFHLILGFFLNLWQFTEWPLDALVHASTKRMIQRLGPVWQFGTFNCICTCCSNPCVFGFLWCTFLNTVVADLNTSFPAVIANDLYIDTQLTKKC